VNRNIHITWQKILKKNTKRYLINKCLFSRI
jgi:hypothetical protein